MPTYGTVKRAKPRVTILRGFDPNQPRTKTQAVRVQSGVVILSGMVISQVWDAGDGVYEWVKGWAAGRIPYIALQDSADLDVVSANSLVGYSCLGDFEIQTGYFKDGETYVVDTPLTPGLGGDLGYVTPTTADSGDPILGYVTRNHEPVNLASGGATGYPQDSSATDEEVITFQTAWVPNPEVS